MSVPETYLSTDEIASSIPDGALIGVPKEDGGVSMEITRALIRRKARRLRLLTVPVETSGVSMGEFGYAPHFRRAVENGDIVIRDATCPALYAELQASEKGTPFMPLRGILGSDILANRPDWKTIDNPMADGGGDPVVLLPAARPDFAVFHAPFGDRHGNVWVGAWRECVLLAHASAETLVTVEEIWDGNLMEDQRMLAGTIPPIYVGAVAHAPRGAWPLSLPGSYERDGEHLKSYLTAAKSKDGFAAYLDRYVFSKQGAA